MIKAFLSGVAVATAGIVLLLFLNGERWEPVGVFAMTVGLVANGIPSRERRTEPYYAEPAPRISAAPGDRWWERTDTLPTILPTDTQPMSRRAMRERQQA